MDSMNTILFGFKRAGKTYLGKQLAKQLQCPFIDTDDLLQKASQQPVADLYQQLGEEAFRTLETQMLLSLKPTQRSVIALGGGSVLNPVNTTYLKSIGHLVYLKVDLPTLQDRILRPPLPVFLDPQHPLESLHKLYQARIVVYETIAASSNCIILNDEQHAHMALDQLLLLLHQLYF
jgi:shikimate kinase